MNEGDIFWTHVKITSFGDRIVPYYFQRRGISMIYGIIANGKDECGFSEKDVFETVEEARTATCIDRVFCYASSSHEHWNIVSKIHEDEGLVCPNCEPGTAIIELDPEIFPQETGDGYTHFCFRDRDTIGKKTRQHQVTLGRRNGCASYITL